MPNPSGPDRENAANPPLPGRDTVPADPAADTGATPDPGEQITDSYPVWSGDVDAATEVLATEVLATEVLTTETANPAAGGQPEPERRFTAPGFDADHTEIIHSAHEPPTEVFDVAQSPAPKSRKAAPQLIPPRIARRLPASATRSWGGILALIVIIVALAAIAVLGTAWLTHGSRAKASQEDQVRDSIYRFDTAVQNGDLPALRGLTCGSVRDDYLNYNEQVWDDTYRRIAAAKQYPVVANIDQVVVNGDHAEANVTAFMAYAPQVRSTRSFDLQYRDDQWKICQSRTE